VFKLAVAGNPIVHSKSPELFKSSGLALSYIKIQTSSAKNLVEYLLKNKFDGCNLTSPLKETIIPYLDTLDDISKTIGAINTLKIQSGKLMGFNTDPYGIIASLKPFTLGGKKGLILGTGGACKSAIYALQNLQVSLTITGRNESKLNDLAKHFRASSILWTDVEKKIKDFDLVISTLPSILDCAMDLPISSDQIFLDANYKDVYLEKYPHRINGLAWLKAQAAKSLEIFTGEKNCPLNFLPSGNDVDLELIVLD